MYACGVVLSASALSGLLLRRSAPAAWHVSSFELVSYQGRRHELYRDPIARLISCIAGELQVD